MIQQVLHQLRGRNEAALIAFVTAGDPSLGQLPEVLAALEQGGADIIEVGIPFSDPIADGPVIQAASQRSLDRGTTPGAVLESLSQCDTDVPIILMGYYNPMLRRGLARFAKEAKSAGASGFIVCDLIPEEGADWGATAQSAGLETIYLAAPTSTDARLDLVAGASSGFVYAVARTGVTGASAEVSDEALQLVDRIRSRTELPICVGFGISRPEHVRAVCSIADGAVVGSYLVDLLANDGVSALEKAVRELKQATRNLND